MMQQLAVTAPPLSGRRFILESTLEDTVPAIKMAYRMNEVAEMLSISLRTVETLIAQKQLLARRIGRRVVVPHTALASFLRQDHYTDRIAA